MIQVFTSLIQKFFKKKQTNIFEISKRKPTVKENENTLVTDHSIVIEAKEVKQQFKCRICLDQGETPDSAVCMPCKCSGSMKYVHVECLQAWIIQKKSLKCEICNYEYSIKWFKWADQHNILDNPTLKKLQQSSNQQRQRRQQAQNEQNRIRHYQNLLRSFGKRKSLTVIQKLQIIFLISGIIVCFVFAYSNNQSENWQQSKNSKQHQRVYFTSIISYCLTIIVAYFWISQSKGFEYTFQTNLNYFKTHLPSLQQNNVINLQQQQYMQDQQLDQNNSNSQIEIDVQQQNQEHQVNGERGQIYLNFQQNQNQSQQYEQQDQQIQNNNIQYIQQNNNQVEELQQQQQQNDLSLQSKANQEMHIDIENQNDQVQDSFQNAKQYPFCQDIKKNYKIIIFNKKRNASSIKYNIQDQMAKQFNSKNVIQTDSNGVIPLGDNIHQSKTQEFQLSQTDQQPSQIHQNQEILGFGSFKIDQNRKIIEFGESESSEETIQEKFQIKRENKQYFDNEQEVQLNNLERKHEENIPSTYREKQQSNTCIDIKQQKLILKHKQKKQQSKQDLSKIENNTQYIEQNQEQIHSIQENNNDENQQNIQQIQQHDNTLVPDKTSSINQQIKQIQCVKDNEDHSSGQQIFQEQSNTDHHIQQQQQQMHENQVELINFECNESIEIQNDNIKSTSDQHQGLGLNMEDIQVILSNEENVPSQKTFDQQSARKQSHNNDIKSDWQKYLKNE
ncbi:RING-variant domain protein (macronuclear) [Tetrahymena thermophila SB210]|uniref:RING-variant domain protein n=1 Tax=Tetrahymena thermophila (strain SB210) TaxID=312017 RepID=I7MJG3_TETTS|nr:RING-variant domain protein [Tetrahymena thermophila SB210]EAR96315.2 RING-variant domain protein [Tetrahymena thermophila SB210]|eukprot:XP_001016560.2 RING-variant domain protein [Tetrahymena thermophila SB210]